MAREGVPNLGRSAVPIVGQGDCQHGHTPRPVAFVDDRLPVFGIGGASARLGDGAVDGVVRHRLALGALDRHAEPKIGIGIGATLTNGDMDLTRELAEDRALLEVSRCFLSFDLRPFGMASHERVLLTR